MNDISLDKLFFTFCNEPKKDNFTADEPPEAEFEKLTYSDDDFGGNDR